MYFSVETVLVVLMVGAIVGLLPGTIVHRSGLSLLRDAAIGIAGAFVIAWLALTAPDFILPPSEGPPGQPSESTSADMNPNYEPVVLPLAPLRPLLKPVVYRSSEEICDSLTHAARSNDLPTHFFIRLLYQESSFRPAAISSAGALGIAQFMPETANDRGLDNPFDPLQAIPASARLLRDLYRKFGNLGLAAAAYNAGPRRISDWLAKKGSLPQETQDYVRNITGWPAENWTGSQTGIPAVKLPRAAPCQEAAGLLAWNGPDQIPLPPPNPRVKEPPVNPKTAAPKTVTDTKPKTVTNAKTLRAVAPPRGRTEASRPADLARN
ncbi:MAG TPA: lytic transglycosylase domain-containing protein [Pseudolabrys sp.]|nr:lytic transglycosylase domain-containing protein [Pseudolabrys sp.]